jgi:hypothetical protein
MTSPTTAGVVCPPTVLSTFCKSAETVPCPNSARTGDTNKPKTKPTEKTRQGFAFAKRFMGETGIFFGTIGVGAFRQRKSSKLFQS